MFKNVSTCFISILFVCLPMSFRILITSMLIINMYLLSSGAVKNRGCSNNFNELVIFSRLVVFSPLYFVLLCTSFENLKF